MASSLVLVHGQWRKLWCPCLTGCLASTCLGLPLAVATKSPKSLCGDLNLPSGLLLMRNCGLEFSTSMRMHLSVTQGTSNTIGSFATSKKMLGRQRPDGQKLRFILWPRTRPKEWLAHNWRQTSLCAPTPWNPSWRRSCCLFSTRSSWTSIMFFGWPRVER